MTLPSAILTSMRSVLETRLGESVREVRIHEGAIGLDPKDTILSGKDPLVLVTLLGSKLQGDGYGITDGVWGAFVITKNDAKDTSGNRISRGLIGANAAHLIAAIVESEMWGGLMYGRAIKIVVGNEHTEKLSRESGWSIWSCAWTQPFEIKVADTAEYGRLGSIHYTFEMGGLQTPDALATIVFPEPTP
jgi:hypothetical protein